MSSKAAQVLHVTVTRWHGLVQKQEVMDAFLCIYW